MTRLSTHVLDTSRGRPAAGIAVRLFQAERQIAAAETDSDGRCAGMEVEEGVYRLVFDVASYFPDSLYPEITISFKAAAGASHYHIPLLLSPFGYTTYRGS